MRHRLIISFFVCVAALASLPGIAQPARIVASAQAPPELRGEIMRETVDPCLGLHWQWIADPAHPEWPYHLVLADATVAHLPAVSASAALSPRAALPASAPIATPVRVIRAGDLIIVNQQTGTVNARLQALALDSAAAGRPLRVRLTVSGDRSLGMNSLLSSSGPVITVTAQAPGEALWSITPVRSTVEEQSR